MSAPSRRLPSGGLIDRGIRLSFTFDGAALSGHPGDTLASALLAGGVRLVGRSFKYHRPRGIMTAGSEEPNALVEIGAGARREPNTRATATELYDGLVAASQNRWPSLRHDFGAVNSLLSRFLSAGFYYKTFMWPPALWEKLYEPLIRRAAGLGRASGAADPDIYEKAWAHCDVLVIGGGPAGLAAALAAGRAGARVILCDEDFRLGGRLLSDGGTINNRSAPEWLNAALAELSGMANVTVMPRTAVTGVFDHGTYAALERVADHMPEPPPHLPRQRLWRIVARRAVLCAGAIERPIVFPGNDRPGVMMASAARSYINRYGVRPAARAVLFVNGDDGLSTLGALEKAGVEVAAVADTRTGARIVSAEGGAGGLRAVRLEEGGAVRNVPCDGLFVSGGWNPVVHLTCHLGGRPAWREDIAAFVPGTPPPGLSVAGAANGDLTLGACLSGGFLEGVAAAGAAGHGRSAGEPPAAANEPAALSAFWHVDAKGMKRGKAFVDMQHDVTADDIALAHREGFVSVEHLKRYTTLGMATDQGKTANVNGLAIMASISGRTIPETGTTVFRPPYVPVAIGAFAGRSRGRDFRPYRLPPSHEWASGQGASFVETGQWLRAEWYARPGERDWLETVDREVLAVRGGVGFCDVSTLGKIEILGPDAGRLLDRVYCNTFSTLPVGRARYGLMLREDGFVMDDGTTSRLAEDRYFMTTTTANAALVFQHLEYCRQVLWPSLDVSIVSASDQWAQFSVAGPRSRELLTRILDPGIDISNAALPFMGVRDVAVGGGIPGRLYRISFSGELAYEIAVPSRYGAALAANMMAAGLDLGCTPYGVEALSVMRIEKGHVAGAELNGTTTAGDLGLQRMMSSRKDYVGRVMAARPALTDPRRWNVVGVRPLDARSRLRAGAHFIPEGEPESVEHDKGYMTSVCHSPVIGSWIGLALIERGRERIGERMRAVDPVRAGSVLVEICEPCFYDPEGGRQRG
ncbi:MAG: sarcosine oxidase subunit alpha family protein [Flavobacteriaceae bacterium]